MIIKGVKVMGIIPYTENDVALLARLMRAEAEGEGTLGMLLVGNVGVNRVKANCLDFKNIRSVSQMVFQNPGGFEATQKGYFYQKARPADEQLARRVLEGERFWPATYALWFFKPEGDCPDQWYSQDNSGRYKNHCFFEPSGDECPDVYRIV